MLQFSSAYWLLPVILLLLTGYVAYTLDGEVQPESEVAQSLLLTWNEPQAEAQLIAFCSPPCEHNGTCRVDMQTLQPVCLCTLDYSGMRCENDAVPPLENCSENTCLNGGFCAGTQEKPFCSCPVGVRGPNCERRDRSFEVRFVMMNNSGALSWSDSLLNASSTIYQDYSTAVMETLQLATRLGDDPALARTFLSCNNVTFSPGSVWATVTVTFDFTENLSATYTVQLILDHLRTGGRKIPGMVNPTTWIPTDFGQSNSTTFNISAIDPCTSNNHDCSKFATCKTVLNGVYSCHCNPFTIDTSPDIRFPGRRCIYDGLIIVTFVVIGIILSSTIFVLCGCRRTIWYRRHKNVQHENVTLVKMPANYDI